MPMAGIIAEASPESVSCCAPRVIASGRVDGRPGGVPRAVPRYSFGVCGSPAASARAISCSTCAP